MRTHHKVEIFDYKKVWSAIKEMHVKIEEEHEITSKKRRKQKPVPRGVYLDHWRSPLGTLSDITAAKFQLIGMKTR